jgi:hypothetical protein
MGIKRADLWYYGTIGEKEYNSGNRIYSITPDNNSSKEKIVRMGYQIGTGRAIKKGNNPNEYIEDLGELQIIYKYINEHSDLEISWKWIKTGVQDDNAGGESSATPTEPISVDEIDFREITFPDKVEGIVYGEKKELTPNTSWAIVGGGGYAGDPLKNKEGRYNVAVGPKILNPNYPDKGKIWASDFYKFNKNIDVVVLNKKTNKEEIIKCYASDIKAHSFNTYDNGKVKINIESGLIQTGILYPNGTNKLKFAKGHIDGSVIEFATGKIDFNIKDYKLIKVRVYKNK